MGLKKILIITSSKDDTVSYIMKKYFEMAEFFRVRNKWNLHLIEMKSSVGAETWRNVKGKFRASYLLAQGLAAMLDMDIAKTYMYTTYEEAKFTLPGTMPSVRRVPSGSPLIQPEKEWSGEDFGLNFGIRLKFIHTPVHMERDSKDVLVGEYCCDKD